MLEAELPLLFHTDIIDLVYVCSLPLYDHTYAIELVNRQLVAAQNAAVMHHR